MIAGLEEIDGGEIAIDGRVVNDILPRDRDIAMVFQNYALYPYLNVFENIAFGLRARKTPAGEIDQRVRSVSNMLGIAHLLERLPRELSGGQRQRVAMGRAVVRRPALFLFDEPLSNLDAQLRDDVRAEIKALHGRLRATMIYVTHDQLEALTLADRIVLMRDGFIEQMGSPTELYERPATRFAASFIGSPQINFVDAQLMPGPDGTPGFQLEDSHFLPAPRGLMELLQGRLGEMFSIGIRPEYVHPAERSGEIAGAALLRMRTGIVQPAGARAYVTFSFGSQKIQAEFPSHGGLISGADAEVAVDVRKLVVVDPRDDRVLQVG
jgi:multiple sugar transport system ATP-binding protein